jgi:beta-glucanase (GH16 family)
MNTRRSPLLSSSLRRVEYVSSRCLRSSVFSFLLVAASALAQGFPVTVIDPGNAPLPLTVEATNIIQDVKQQIFVARGYPVAQQVLVNNERRLLDSSTVADNSISTNDLLYLTLDNGLSLNISSISAITGMVGIVTTQMTAGITQIIEQSPSLLPPAAWTNASEGFATSSGTNWILAMEPGNESSFYRIRERDPDPPITEYPGYELFWHDEFEGSGINPTNWWHQLGDGTLYGLAPGWGNAEQQIYTNAPENSRIFVDDENNSVLLIEAIQGTGSSDYTSARLVTDGLQSFRFGRIEARIRLPYSQGAWPAFWMMGTNIPVVNWPGCGEIDILEMLGGEEDTVHGSLFYVDEDHLQGGSTGTETLPSGLFSDDYHIYGIDWTPTNMTWSVDSVAYHTTPLGDDMLEFQRGFYIILNIAVGGFWPGNPDGTSVFPMRMFVDYVRVYTDLSLVDPGEPPLDIDEETLGEYVFDGSEAIQNGFAPFEYTATKTYGPGSPTGVLSSNAVDGVWSVDLTWNPSNFGGMWWQIASPTNENVVVPTDMSAYAGGNLVFALQVSTNVTEAFEVKLESQTVTGSKPFGNVNLLDYTPVPLSGGFAEYTIPLADFTVEGFDLSQVAIPFSLWNPKDSSGYVAAEVLIDNIHWTLP